MALSPNYGWAEPDNSSLVKNGAQDIRALGDAIDTSVWNVGYGQAGKNKIINGDFYWNQRNFTSTTSADYGFDRWQFNLSGGTGTGSAQTFTLGSAPVAGYEAKNFVRLDVTVGNDFCAIAQTVESVRTFAGQTVTVSFWAKGTNPTTEGGLYVIASQGFGSGGSPSASVNTLSSKFVLTANWTRYSLTIAIPSIAGKTLGTANNDGLRFLIGQGTSTSTDAWTLDLWGVQVEAGSFATPFQTASGGSPQQELAMCQRYFNRLIDNINQPVATLQAISTTDAIGTRSFPEMRIGPTVTYTTVGDLRLRSAINTALTVTGSSAFNISRQAVSIFLTVASGLVAGNATEAYTAGSNARLDLSAEL